MNSNGHQRVDQAEGSATPPGTVDKSQGATVDWVAPAAAETDSPVELPGYRILRKLGQGGMGVVYLALDLKLPRRVAIKMIRSGLDDSEKAQRRFQAEAAAVARLAHPNIVQIHEIGAHDGSDYFVLEYVGGGTLASKTGQPMADAEAAKCVMLLARAVQAAHQEGIIHRDLKPANVLLTPDGTPKITDFGLAKHLNADQSLSQAGDIVGTPCYMAPEQAFGNVKDVSPATDIYALGAILYESLTGRPPFKGANTLETLEQVRHDEPTPPRQLRSSLPRDLETICLTCLRKEPTDRYASALALAQDLERFLAGEAILARPEGMLARTARKVRRNRAASLLIAALLLVMLAATALVYRSWDAARVQDFENRLKASVEALNWDDTKIKDHAALIEQLAALAPERQADVTEQFRKSIYASATRRLQAVTALAPEDKVYVEHMITVLRERAPAKATELQAAYQARLSDYDEVFKLTSPTIADLGLQAFRNDPRPGGTLLTKFRCEGNVRLESTWARWEDVDRLGLSLNGDVTPEMSGYVFLLEALPDPGKKASTTPRFAEVRQWQGKVRLAILRNGVALRQLDLPLARIAAGPLRLQARRQGDRLEFLLPQGLRLEARDLIPLMPRGFCGLIKPQDAALELLRGMRQGLPTDPGPLERGDELFVQGKFAEAHDFFAQQAIKLLGTPYGSEARYKSAFTLQQLKRGQDAVQTYESLVKDDDLRSNDKWIMLGYFQLWVEHLRNKDLERANGILNRLLSSREFVKSNELMLYLPVDIGADVRGAYLAGSGALGMWRHDPDRLLTATRLAEVEELLQSPYQVFSQQALVRLLRLEGRLNEAIQTLEKWLQKLPVDDAFSGPLLAAEYGWLMRENKTPGRALNEIERRLYRLPGVYYDDAISLLIARARVRAAMQAESQAEQDVEEFLSAAARQPHSLFRDTSDAWLLLGTLREGRGDMAGALQAWRTGRYQGDPSDPDFLGTMAGGIGVLNAVILDSMCDSLDAKRVEALLRNVFRNQPTVMQAINQFGSGNLFQTIARVNNHMWRTPRGKEFARKIALQSCAFQEYVRLPLTLFLEEFARDETLGSAMAAEQTALLRQFADDSVTAVMVGKLQAFQYLQLAYLWKRGPAPLFGINALKSLNPDLRGPAAYFMGLRFQRMNLPAEQVFRVALECAPKSSPLERLARTALDKGK